MAYVIGVLLAIVSALFALLQKERRARWKEKIEAGEEQLENVRVDNRTSEADAARAREEARDILDALDNTTTDPPSDIDSAVDWYNKRHGAGSN